MKKNSVPMSNTTYLSENGTDDPRLPEVWEGTCTPLPDDNETDTSKKRRVLRKKLKRGGTAAVIGVSVSLASIFSSPSEIMQQQVIRNLNPAHSVEIMIDEETQEDAGERKKAQDEPLRQSVFSRFRQAVKDFVQGLPAPVKACVCVPLWAAGYVLVQLAEFLFGAVVSPLMGHVFGLLLFAAALLAAYALTAKCLFPHMPFRKILSWKNVLRVLAGAVLLKAADLVIPLFWSRYFTYRNIVMLVLGVLILGLIIFRFRRKHQLSG